MDFQKANISSPKVHQIYIKFSFRKREWQSDPSVTNTTLFIAAALPYTSPNVCMSLVKLKFDHIPSLNSQKRMELNCPVLYLW